MRWTFAAVAVIAWTAQAEDAALREEFDAYRKATESRIGALEARLGERVAETNAPSLPEAFVERATLDFEFHGYFRAGLGVNGDGDAMEAFKAPGAESKYRLGNEAETYIEAAFQQNFTSPRLRADGVDIFTKLTFAYFTPTVDNNDFNTTTSLREAYAAARGVWSAKKEALFWAGNRFYEHLDIHISDFFFRDMAGFGGGIEDVALGEGDMKWAAAWLGGSIDQLSSSGTAYENDYHFNKNTLDLRLYGIETAAGRLALVLDLAHFSGDTLVSGGTPITITDSSGWAAGAILATPLGGNRSNRFTAQYGEGAADNFKAVITAPKGIDLSTVTRIDTDGTRRLRLTDDILLDEGEPLTYQLIGVYERYDNGFSSMDTIDWASLGARPVYHLNTYFSLALEAGADYTRQKDGPEGTLGKLTFAPQIQPRAAFLARPSIRAFVTYAAWTDGFEGLVAPVSYGNARQGLSAGVQMEAWW